MGIRRFWGGVHPADEKQRTEQAPIEKVPLPERLFVPLSQHIGTPATPLVRKGDRVLAGQPIGEAAGFISAPVHAPTSGTVRRIGPYPHPGGTPQTAVEIEVDGEDAWFEGCQGLADPLAADPAALRAAIRDAGIVGMGGAAFPTYVKLSPPDTTRIDTVILNGVECEPYLTADHRLMLEEPERILHGLQVILAVLGVGKGFIGIERNKPDAIALLTRLAQAAGYAEIVPLKVRYPQGAEKQLIYALTGRQVPSGGLPLAVGAVVQNVGTAAAIWDAVAAGRPLVGRVATVTGPAVRTPKNLRFRVGTPLRHLIDQCGGLTDDVAKVVLGGPMMGMAQHSLEVPATKGTSGILALTQARAYDPGPCLRCGRCREACPMGLAPAILRAFTAAGRTAEAAAAYAADCIECGSCAYRCPAHIPLVQTLKVAKARILADRKRQARDAA